MSASQKLTFISLTPTSGGRGRRLAKTLGMGRVSGALGRWFCVAALTLIHLTLGHCARGDAAQAGIVEYLSDRPELLSATQDWGVLGFDVAAHTAEAAGQSLQIGDHVYAKGLGHHANGVVIVMLDGAYSEFEAEVGLQADPASSGRVTFRVSVDGRKEFDSGVMTQGSAAKPVRLSVTGAKELRLEANAVGDGIAFDMADWADARLKGAMPEGSVDVDVARFGRVVTWNPNRMDGCRASRIEEFGKEDLFLESDLRPRAGGGYVVPVATNGLGCIGLQWLNRRALKEVSLEFDNAAQTPPTKSVHIEGWFGESVWQGGWKALAGDLEAVTNKLVFHLSAKAGPVQTQKLRWVFPATDRCVARSLSAFTRSRWSEVKLVIEAEKSSRNARGAFTVYDGELAGTSSGRVRQEWTLSRPLHIDIRYSRASSFKSDATVLQFRLPAGAFGVAVEDVLANQCVYVPESGLFVACESAHLSLADYKERIAGRKTILAQVREMPDQTLAQAMAKTRHAVQDKGPVMLSLACDNVKFTVAREGTIEFATSGPLAANEFASSVGEMRPKLGSVARRNLQRHLEGDWLPIPVLTVESGGILYTQRSFVVPCDADGAEPTRLNRQSVCVAEFTARNASAAPAEAVLSLSFVENLKAKKRAKLDPAPRGYWVVGSNGPMALVDTTGVGPLRASVTDGSVRFEGTLPAETTARCVVYLPGVNLKAEDLGSVAEPGVLAKAVEAYWQAALAPAMRVEIPDGLLQNVIRSSQVRCLIDARSEANGARIAPWIAAMAYGPLESESHSVIRGMDLMGHRDFAQRGLDYFIHRYNQAGFLTTGYTVFGTGWHLWTLGEHYQLDHDTEWFAKAAPEVARVGQWICRQLDKTKQRDASGQPRPEFGLMPPGVLADWNAFAYHFCMNAYYYAALRETGMALKQLHHPSGEVFLAKAAELRANLLRAYRWTQSQAPVVPLRDGTWVPAYVSQVHSPGKLADFFPGQDAGRSWCYDVELGAHQLVPTGVLNAGGPEVTQMLQHMEDVQFLADGWFDYAAAANHADWFNLGGFSKVQPYYTRNAEIYAMRDEVKPFVRSYFNTLAAMLNTEALTIWEHFHNNGAWDKTHETGYFLQQTRFMLVMEHDKELWLAPLLTSNWFKSGMTIAVENAPTRFGKISYRIQSHADQGYIEVRVDPPDREAPKKLVLRLRHPEGKPIRSVAVNGKPTRSFDPLNGTVSFKAQRPGPITVKAEY